MKTGILTFHCAHNYGAVLQAYALQEFLKSLGHEVEVIDYRPEYLTAGYGAFPFPRLAGASLVRKAFRLGRWGLRLPWRVSQIPMRVRRRAGFEKFISGRMNLSRERFAEGGRVPAESAWTRLLASCAVSVVCVAGSVWFLGFSESERNALKGFLDSRFKGKSS